jgi:multidrug resistance protein MdtO
VSLFSAEKVSELDRFWREMAPVPGRTAGTLRFALASAVATLLLLIIQPAVGFIAPSLFMLFLVSHDTPYHCFKDLLTCVSFATLGTASALLLVIATGNHPVARVVGVAVSTFLATFFFRASTIPLAPLSFGCLAYMTINLWENHLRPERILRLSLWPIGTLAIVALSGTVVDYLFNRSDPLLALQREIKARCSALEQLFQLCATRAAGERIEKQSAIVRRYAVTGEGQMHVLLERISKRNSCSSAELRELTTVTMMLDRLVVLGAGFTLNNEFEAVDPARLQRISEAIVAAGEGHLQKVRHILSDTLTPLPGELERIERTLHHFGESADSNTAELTSEGLQASPSSRSWSDFFKHLLVPDAFTNYDYFMYALKLSVCATICYVFYNGVKWPGIATAIYFTVYFTGLSTTGASNRKLVFRLIGSAIGGLILGIGCLVFVFPNIEGVQGFLLVIAVLAFLGAWIGGSSYFGYLGLQITYAFNLIAFERLRTPDQMTPARDRCLGIAIGFLVMFVIFHQVRPERTVDTMRRLLARLLRAGADLVHLVDMEPNVNRDATITAIRKQLSAGIVNLRSFGDVVKYEFPPDRAADMKLSDEILNAMSSAADILIGLPAWPQKTESEQSLQLKEIRDALGNGLREMASSLEQLPREQQPSAQDAVLEKLRNTLPVSVVKTIDGYRELKMACADILRAAA